MARRSARLQKQPTPARDASVNSNDDSWMTAASSPTVQLPTLPEMPDLPDPSIKTPQKPAQVERQPASKLPHATATPTPRSQSFRSLLPATSSRTPNNRTPIKPAGQEMHPAHHHASTAKVLDEARWLGFQALGANTAPPKTAGAIQGTPSKTPVPTANATRIESSPDFRFRFKSPFAGLTKTSKKDDESLSPSTRNLLREVTGGDTPIASRALFGATEFSSKADVSPERKKVEPKGKIARFSDVHMQQFKKMDSIANHASAFRADPTRFKPVITQPLKKSPSKPDIAKAETSKLKRTQSKMNMTESSSKIPPTPLKRTQSKMDLTGSSLPRSQSTVRLVPPTRDGHPSSREGPTDNIPTAKRVKRTEVDDAATTRPISRDGRAIPAVRAAPTPARKITSQTALPRLASRLMTPTRSSIARSQSVKTMKSTSMIPALTGNSPSKTNLFSPTNMGQAMRDGARESMRKASENLQRMRSILRTPSRKFSDDPVQIAAGTHMSPPSSNFEKALPPIPATAPAKKHVNFTNSTLQRASDEELGKSPSPMKLRAGSEVPTGAVLYPTLAGVSYPDIVQGTESPTTSPSRRLSFGGEAPNHPRSFSFESGKAINFGPPTTGTIRIIRKSDAGSLAEGKKRKLDTVQESSDKENSAPADDNNCRSAKKMRPTPAEPATPSKTPSASSKLPRHTPGRGSAISKSRLAFLATPKRGKA